MFKQNLFSKVIWSSTFKSNSSVVECSNHNSKMSGLNHVSISYRIYLFFFLKWTQKQLISWKHFTTKFTHMCFDLAESVRSWEHIARKGMFKFLLFSIVQRILQLLITLEPLVRFRWGFLQNVHLQISTSIKWKTCHMLDFRLISLDCITYWGFRHGTCLSGRQVTACHLAIGYKHNISCRRRQFMTWLCNM